MSKFLQIFLVLCITLPALVAQSALAQDDSDSGWEHTAVVYLLAPTIDGTVGIGGIDGDIKIEPSTVFETLDMGFLGGWASEKDNKWGVLFDVIYMDLSQDFEVLGEKVPGEVGNKQWIANANFLYRVTDNMQLLGGLVYTDISMSLSLDGPLKPRKQLAGDSWVDPVAGLRYSRVFAERWMFTGFGYIGGFGVGSDLLWSLNGSLSFQMTEHTHLVGGYRYIQYDYESGNRSQPGYFKFDVAEHGPALGLRWNF